MKCVSTDCMYYMGECIQKNVLIEKGKCPYYKVGTDDINEYFPVPSFYTWEVYDGIYVVTKKGHLLDVMVAFPDATLIAPSTVKNSHFLVSTHKRGAVDVGTHLSIINPNIYMMYNESLVNEYLSQSTHYKITYIDIVYTYIHIKVVDK